MTGQLSRVSTGQTGGPAEGKGGPTEGKGGPTEGRGGPAAGEYPRE